MHLQASQDEASIASHVHGLTVTTVVKLGQGCVEEKRMPYCEHRQLMQRT